MGMMALEWARKMKNDAVEVFLVDPGVMATDFGGVSSEAKRQRGVQGPQKSAEFIRSIIEGEYGRQGMQILAKEGAVAW